MDKRQAPKLGRLPLERSASLSILSDFSSTYPYKTDQDYNLITHTH